MEEPADSKYHEWCLPAEKWHSSAMLEARYTTCLLYACLALQLVHPDALLAQPKRAPRSSVSTLVDELAAADPARVKSALDALGQRKDAAAITALADFVHAGQPDELTDHALQALGQTRAPTALPLLSELTHHRRKAARLAAFAGIAQLTTDAADAELARGLSDSEPAVRGLCARALGERGARSQLDVLFRALARGVPEAGAAIGKLADDEQIARFDAHIKVLPMLVMLEGYEQLLARDDIEETRKLAIIALLGEVASPTVKVFLQRTSTKIDAVKSPRVAQALRETAARIDTRDPKGAKPAAADKPQ